MQGIYKITNLINNTLYIGRTNSSERRWKDHQRLAFTEGHKEYNKTLYKAMRKYGIENFTFEIIEKLKDYSISGEREKYWIAYYDSYHNGYNESEGGDGGSAPGHCRGSQNGRSKLTEEDVIKIRTLFREGISKNKCYILFKDKISEGGFARVWLGQTWKHIMPEVFTKENIKRNEAMGKAAASNTKKILSKEQVLDIRQRRKNGEKKSNVFKDYSELITIATFEGVWYNKTYLEWSI